jgi:hypothetical protein
MARLSGGLFQGNSTTLDFGGGLNAVGMLMLTGTKFVGNRANIAGGGSYLFWADGRIVNALFARNLAGRGAELSVQGSGSTEILHATFAGIGLKREDAVDVGTFAIVGISDTIIVSYSVGIGNSDGTVYQDYNLLANNTNPTAGNVVGGAQNASGYPAFVNAANDDYHLSLSSAALDADVEVGVTTDFDGDARPAGGGFDIGYDEYARTMRRLYLPLVVR